MDVYDFAYACCHVRAALLPGTCIPPGGLLHPTIYPRQLAAYHAHRHTRDFLQFLHDSIGDSDIEEIDRNNIIIVNITNDLSTFNEYLDARFYRNSFRYGQVLDDRGKLVSFASSSTIVAHEVSHALMHSLGVLQEKNNNEIRALNESYADIFAVLFANRHIQNFNDNELNGQIGENDDPDIQLVSLINRRFPSPVMRNLKDPSATGSFQQYSEINFHDTSDDYMYYRASAVHSLAVWKIMTRQIAGQNTFHGPEDIQNLTNLFFQALRSLRSDNHTFAESGTAILNTIPTISWGDRDREDSIGKITQEEFRSVGINIS
jgi:hypothetical protein